MLPARKMRMCERLECKGLLTTLLAQDYPVKHHSDRRRKVRQFSDQCQANSPLPSYRKTYPDAMDVLRDERVSNGRQAAGFDYYPHSQSGTLSSLNV